MATIRHFSKNGKTFTVAEIDTPKKFLLYRGKTTNISKFVNIYTSVPKVMDAIERLSKKR